MKTPLRAIGSRMASVVRRILAVATVRTVVVSIEARIDRCIYESDISSI